MVSENMTFSGVVANGRLPREVGEAVRDVLRRFEGKRMTVTVERYRRKRSNPQNAFYWGCVIPRIQLMFEEAGSSVSAEEVHDFLRSECRITREIIDPLGEVHSTLRSSTELDTSEWEDWMEKIRAWAGERGHQIPFPNEFEI